MRRLANKGWVVPGWITPRQLFALSEMDNDQIDDFFTEEYSSQNFERLKAGHGNPREPAKHVDVGNSPSRDRIVDGRHRVTIPALRFPGRPLRRSIAVAL